MGSDGEEIIFLYSENMSPIVICIGTGACLIAQRSLVQQVDEVSSFIYVDEDKNVGGEKERVTSMLEELAKSLSPDKDAKVILLATLGGVTGSKYVPQVTSILKDCGIKSYAIVTVPFEWEGEKRKDLALDMLDRFVETDCHIFVFMNDRITERHDLFTEGFAWVDGIISALVKAIVSSTTEDFLKGEGKDLFLYK